METYSTPPPTIPLPQPPVIPPRKKEARNGIDDICREVSNLDLTVSQE
jgi:hypothetical protein